MHRSLKEVTLSTTPLFTTAEAKDFLKVDTTADDDLIDNLVFAATESCQIYTNQYFLKVTVEQYSDTWESMFTLYKSPVTGITHIKYYDTADTEQTLDPSNYILDDVSKPARIGLAVDGTLPSLSDRINAVHVNYTVGYGTASTDVPDGIKSAVLITLANLYENRQSVITGRTATELPLSSQYLLDQYKIQVC
mgnify:FL=1|tara:strand:- start:881 stop:1459 length:579 start_codon:yes stop_codon:yes gene_type:complete